MTAIETALAGITLGDVALAAIATALAWEGAVRLLPDRVAGPGGWLIDTGRRGDTGRLGDTGRRAHSRRRG
jgi:hypothetical protein